MIVKIFKRVNGKLFSAFTYPEDGGVFYEEQNLNQCMTGWFFFFEVEPNDIADVLNSWNYTNNLELWEIEPDAMLDSYRYPYSIDQWKAWDVMPYARRNDLSKYFIGLTDELRPMRHICNFEFGRIVEPVDATPEELKSLNDYVGDDL